MKDAEDLGVGERRSFVRSGGGVDSSAKNPVEDGAEYRKHSEGAYGRVET